MTEAEFAQLWQDIDIFLRLSRVLTDVTTPRRMI